MDNKISVFKEEEREPQDVLEEKYIQSLCKKNKQAYLIAKEHLGSSFSLEKSNGFLKWKDKQNS